LATISIISKKKSRIVVARLAVDFPAYVLECLHQHLREQKVFLHFAPLLKSGLGVAWW
jgi:hypothetical protein